MIRRDRPSEPHLRISRFAESITSRVAPIDARTTAPRTISIVDHDSYSIRRMCDLHPSVTRIAIWPASERPNESRFSEQF